MNAGQNRRGTGEGSTASRFTDLAEAFNLRDLGGLKTQCGSVTRSGMIFRSASLYGLTEAQAAVLQELRIVLVMDLRSDAERADQPSCIIQNTWSRSYNGSNADLMRAFSRADLSATEAASLMAEVYRTLPEEQAESYAELFCRIADGELPLLFHCSAGKDRTGIATAILLELLGVARGIIMKDYMRTRAMIALSIKNVKRALKKLGMPEMEDALLEPILGVAPDYLQAMFSDLDGRYGSVMGYIEQRLRLDAVKIAAIRQNLLANQCVEGLEVGSAACRI